MNSAEQKHKEKEIERKRKFKELVLAGEIEEIYVYTVDTIQMDNAVQTLCYHLQVAMELSLQKSLIRTSKVDQKSNKKNLVILLPDLRGDKALKVANILDEAPETLQISHEEPLEDNQK